MATTSFTPLSEADRKHNDYLDRINHAPYFPIFLMVSGAFVLFTILVLVGVF